MLTESTVQQSLPWEVIRQISFRKKHLSSSAPSPSGPVWSEVRSDWILIGWSMLPGELGLSRPGTLSVDATRNENHLGVCAAKTTDKYNEPLHGVLGDLVPDPHLRSDRRRLRVRILGMLLGGLLEACHGFREVSR